jgi:hypothetical protein
MIQEIMVIEVFRKYFLSCSRLPNQYIDLSFCRAEKKVKLPLTYLSQNTRGASHVWKQRSLEQKEKS